MQKIRTAVRSNCRTRMLHGMVLRITNDLMDTIPTSRQQKLTAEESQRRPRRRRACQARIRTANTPQAFLFGHPWPCQKHFIPPELLSRVRRGTHSLRRWLKIRVASPLTEDGFVKSQ